MANEMIIKKIKGMGELVYYPKSEVLTYYGGHSVKADFGFIDGRRAWYGKQYIDWCQGKFDLLLFPTTLCYQDCSYCKIKDRDLAQIDLKKLEVFLVSKARLFRNVSIYGGEGLLVDGLMDLIGQYLKGTNVIVTTGLGFPERMMDGIWKLPRNTGFTVSIDPPGNPYSRSYPAYPGDWYRELIRRTVRLSERFHVKVKATLTEKCWDVDQLIDDLGEAGFAGKIVFSVDRSGTTVKLKKSLVERAEMSMLCPREMMNPDKVFLGTSCTGMLGKINVGASGEFGLCYCGKKQFGTIDQISLDGYAEFVWEFFHGVVPNCLRFWPEDEVIHRVLDVIKEEPDVEVLSADVKRRVDNLMHWQGVIFPTKKECLERVTSYFG